MLSGIFLETNVSISGYLGMQLQALLLIIQSPVPNTFAEGPKIGLLRRSHEYKCKGGQRYMGRAGVRGQAAKGHRGGPFAQHPPCSASVCLDGPSPVPWRSFLAVRFASRASDDLGCSSGWSNVTLVSHNLHVTGSPMDVQWVT